MQETNIYLTHLKGLIESQNYQYNQPLAKMGYHTIETEINLDQFNIDAIRIIEEISELIVSTALKDTVKCPSLFLGVPNIEILFNRLLLDKKLPNNMLLGQNVYELLSDTLTTKMIPLQHDQIIGKKYNIEPELNTQTDTINGRVILYNPENGIASIDIHDFKFLDNKLKIQFSTRTNSTTILISLGK